MGVVISGNMTCTHDDGSEVTVGAGDAFYFPPGHDGYVIVDEPFALYEIVEAVRTLVLGNTHIDSSILRQPKLPDLKFASVRNRAKARDTFYFPENCPAPMEERRCVKICFKSN